MGRERRKEIERHLTEAELDEKLEETTDPKLLQRLYFLKNLYAGDTLGDAARRVGKSQPTGVRWANRWNEDGLDGLAPDWGDGRPPKLDAADQARLRELLQEDGPWTTQEIRHLIEKNLALPTIQIISMTSSGRSGCTTRNRARNVPSVPRTPRRSSTVA
jgi:transposase